MSNPIKKSLEENKEQILKDLPEEFHSCLEAEISNCEPIPALSDEDAVKEAVEVIRHNPSIAAISDEDCQAILDNAETFMQEFEPATEAELKKQQEELLAEVAANADNG